MLHTKTVAMLLVLLGLVLIIALAYYSAIGVAYRAVLAIILMIAIGMAIKKMLKLHGSYGFYMIGSKSGISTIDKISKKYPKFWEGMATWGLTVGFGVLSYFILKGKIDKRVYALGIASTAIIYLFVLPYAMVGLSFINVPILQNQISAHSSQPVNMLYIYIIIAAIAISGFAGYVMLALSYRALQIIYQVGVILYNMISGVALTSSVHGLGNLISGVFLIPGIDMPLIAGLASLAILLIVHEFSHGILARIFKVKLKSIGMLVFGVVPLGAFVEPDDKMIKKLSPEKQTKIFSAGISSNLVAMLLFFVLFSGTSGIMQSAIKYAVVILGTSAGYPANGIIAPGTIIYKWDGHTVNSAATLESAAINDKPGKVVTLVTNKGTYNVTAIADPTNSSRGLIGVDIGVKPEINTPLSKTLYFLYMLFALSLMLNFLVAVVNLLPIPGFDGWQVLNANIKRKSILKAFTIVVTIIFIINFIPLAALL
ncbi:MAG: site-2 protease family protein [Candidatus Micrarchaeia archaeon]